MTEPTLENRPKKNLAMNYHTSEIDKWYEGFEAKLRALLENNAVCDNCPLRGTCENNPYDCEALDALKRLFGKETT